MRKHNSDVLTVKEESGKASSDLQRVSTRIAIPAAFGAAMKKKVEDNKPSPRGKPNDKKVEPTKPVLVEKKVENRTIENRKTKVEPTKPIVVEKKVESPN